MGIIIAPTSKDCCSIELINVKHLERSLVGSQHLACFVLACCRDTATAASGIMEVAWQVCRLGAGGTGNMLGWQRNGQSPEKQLLRCEVKQACWELAPQDSIG